MVHLKCKPLTNSIQLGKSKIVLVQKGGYMSKYKDIVDFINSEIENVNPQTIQVNRITVSKDHIHYIQCY